MTLGIGCSFLGALFVSEGIFRYFHTEKVHYFWECLKYEQPLAPSSFRLWSLRAGAVLEVLMGCALFWAAAIV